MNIFNTLLEFSYVRQVREFTLCKKFHILSHGQSLHYAISLVFEPHKMLHTMLEFSDMNTWTEFTLC